MIRTRGWELRLSGDAKLPAQCARCGGAGETAIAVHAERGTDAFLTFSQLAIPYCRSCAARVRRAGWGLMVLFTLTTLLSIALPIAASLLGPREHDAETLAVAGALGALLITMIATLVLSLSPPAVTTGLLSGQRDFAAFCTHEAWAKAAGQRNHTAIVPATRWRLAKIAAILWCAALGAGMVVVIRRAEARGDLSALFSHSPKNTH